MKCNKHDIDIIEGTTHIMKFVCYSEGKPYKLNEYNVVFVVLGCGEEIKKEIAIKDNVITARLDPNDTKGKYRSKLSYECRAFSKTGDVLHGAFGDINVIKAKAPIIKYKEEL